MNAKKIVTIAGLVLVCLVLVWWVGSAALEAWHGYTWQKQTDAFMEAGRKPYKEDTYGGKTPEETWSMFLAALKKGDVDLASKYFVVEKQNQEKEFLNKEKQLDNLKLFLSQVSNPLILDSKHSNQDKKYYNYYLVVDGKINSNTAIFILNKYTEIWKISIL